MSCTGRKSWSSFVSLGFISGCVLLVSSCSIVELDTLVPSTAIDFVSSDSNLLQYVPNVCPNSVVAKIFENHMKLRSGVSNVQRSLPAELAQDPVVGTLINHSHYVSARAVQTAYMVIKNAPPPPITDVSKPPSNVGPIDIHRFGRLVTDHVWRRTPSTQPASSPDPVAEQFWNNLKAYYTVYFQDNFNNYLGVHLPAPSSSLTISDAEIVQTVQVFIEFLLDEIFHSPVWTSKDSSDKNIYPGGTASMPTYVVINKITPQPISATLPGCGMNVPKAKAIDYLSSNIQPPPPRRWVWWLNPPAVSKSALASLASSASATTICCRNSSKGSRQRSYRA